MGITNHGSQTIVWQYHINARGLEFGKRLLNILPIGIYSGGYLTKVLDSEVSLSTFIVEVADNNNQVSIRTASAATLNSATLDSGSISSSTPYLVMRWSYVTSAGNYLEIHAISSISVAQSNDVIIGKCTFSGATLTGFNYSDRTNPNIQDLFLKPESTGATEMYIRIRGGRIQTSSGYITVADQKVGPFSIPASPNSRIDLVYVDTDGSLAIQQGTMAVSPSAPSYAGKLVLAQVRLSNGDTSIPASRITDVRSFISKSTGWRHSGTALNGGVAISTPVAGTWYEVDSGLGAYALIFLKIQNVSSFDRAQITARTKGESGTWDYIPLDAPGRLYAGGCNKLALQKNSYGNIVVETDSNGKFEITTDTSGQGDAWKIWLMGNI